MPAEEAILPVAQFEDPEPFERLLLLVQVSMHGTLEHPRFADRRFSQE